MNEGSVARSYIITWRISDNGQTNYTRTTAETSTTVTNLQSNTAYDVTIRSRNAAGDGEDSDQASFFTGWFINLCKISTLRSPKIFFYHSRPLFLSINFLAKSSEEQKERSSHPAAVQSSTIQWGDLSKIRDLFAVPLKLLRGPQGNCGP